ncbi:MAG TPA: helix-turn-helix transcriptional regulator [Terriglobales bacterium]|nr:helix-turn-helix transcriptional regulator [Terriglobales bacterium]
MTPDLLHSARRSRGWTQKRAARQLGVTQAYLSMLERGRRVPPPALATRLAEVYSLSPASLPLPAGDWQPPPAGDRKVAAELGRLGYPGLAARRRGEQKNPAEVLLAALALGDVNRRLLQALPWLLLHYPEMDTAWLLDRAKRLDLQNRMGFIVTLAREVREARGEVVPSNLAGLEAALDRSRLARFGTLCQSSMSEEEGRTLYQERSETARRWNLLTDLKAEELPYAAGG